jgi:SAM-dependent methyltransferase
MTYEEKTVSQTIERVLGEHPGLDASAAGALDGLDQFHIGGAAATDKLIGSLGLAEGDRVLDVGSGFGGPSRQIARRTGHHVTGLDITPAYVEAARELSTKAGLEGLTEFVAGDIAAFEPSPLFQAAITMHVQMNVRYKVSWFGQIARCLSPGGRLAVWEVCRPGDAELAWPMPWSLDGTDSFVVAPEVLRASIEEAGFTAVEWTNETGWVRGWMEKAFAPGRPAGPALPMLLDDGYTRVINYAGALGDGSLEVWRGCFTRDAA